MVKSFTLVKESKNVPPLPEEESHDLKQEEQKYQEQENTFLEEEISYPEGGRKAILVVFGCFLCLTGTMGLTNANGTIENYVSNNILVNELTSNVSWIFACYNFMTFATIIIISPMFNLIGSKRMISTSLVFFGIGIMCFSVSKQLYQFILSYCVVGLGCSFSFCTCIHTVTHWFLKRRSTAVGCSLVGSGFGGIIIPIILQQLFKKVGFGWAIRILGFISLMVIFCGLLLIDDRRKELDLLPDSSSPLKVHQVLIGSIKQINYMNLKDPTFLTLVLGCIGNSGHFFLCLNYLISYATANGWDTELAYYLPVVLNSSSIVGRITGGYFSDRYGRFNFFLISNLISTLAVFICWLPPIIGHSTPGLFVYAAVFGYTSGSYYQSSPTCLAQISTVKEFSTRYGTFTNIIAIINFILLPTGGAIVGNSRPSGYDHLIIFIAVIQFLGVIFIFVCRYRCGGFAPIKI